MQRTKRVEVTSSQEKQGIVNTSVQAMSTRVVGQAAEMKKRFVAPITNDEGRPSATRVIDRVVKQTEEALDEIAGNVSKLEDWQFSYEIVEIYDKETCSLTLKLEKEAENQN